ncbi:hypothetical protein [Spirosoma spitsbergense]|uniref:hypothetical protein n=1 Tax=Spirosoma spitsbergense TaxID=431554 RepID=UPI00035E23D9|nr:hypothetical protein [Spirosoma spitsbergense]
MKTYLIALLALSSRLTFGQIPDPNHPQTGTGTKAHMAQLHNRFRRSSPPPAGGFWVVEENAKTPVIVHFYTDGWLEIRTDTLLRKRLNLKERAVVVRLNRRLYSVLNARPAPATVAVFRP